jgi:hypothetical protein
MDRWWTREILVGGIQVHNVKRVSQSKVMYGSMVDTRGTGGWDPSAQREGSKSEQGNVWIDGGHARYWWMGSKCTTYKVKRASQSKSGNVWI